MNNAAEIIWAATFFPGLILFALHFPLGMNPRHDWMHTLSMWLLGASFTSALIPLLAIA